jgi:hypothetical protein
VIVPLLPAIGVIAAIVAAVAGLGYILKKINDQTQIFTNLWAAATDGLNIFKDAADSIANFFVSFGKQILRYVGIFAGAIAGIISDMLFVITSLVKNDPFGVLSKKMKGSLDAASKSMLAFQEKLKAVDYDLFSVGESASEAASKIAKAKFDFEEFSKVVQDLNKAQLGKADQIANEYEENMVRF